ALNTFRRKAKITAPNLEGAAISPLSGLPLGDYLSGVDNPPREAPRTSAWSKVDLFLRQFERWREMARQSPLSQCLETVLTETHYEALLLAEPRGEERVANVRRLT